MNGRRKFDITEHRYLDKCELGLLVPLDLDTGRHVGAGPVPPPLSSLLLHVVVFDPCAAASKFYVFFRSLRRCVQRLCFFRSLRRCVQSLCFFRSLRRCVQKLCFLRSLRRCVQSVCFFRSLRRCVQSVCGMLSCGYAVLYQSGGSVFAWCNPTQYHHAQKYLSAFLM